MISLQKCKHGFLYKIESRNLNFGVFNSVNNGFIGIRYKFGDKFLFTEYHWETGEPFGTVKPLEELHRIPENILLVEHLGSRDSKTGVAIDYCAIKRGWYIVETGEFYENLSPVLVTNQQLFDYLDKL